MKILKKLLTGALTGGMMLAMAVPALAGTPPYAPGTITGQSDAQVEFERPTGANALYLVSVPELDFDKRQLALTDMYYSATDTNYPLTVADVRGVPSAGGGSDSWTVKVKLNEFQVNGTGAVGLQGATVTFKTFTAANYQGVSTGATPSDLNGTTSGTTGPLSAPVSAGVPVPTVPTAATVTAGPATGASSTPAVEVFKAGSGLNIGYWSAHWQPDTAGTPLESSTGLTTADVNLLVKATTATAELYKTKMDWSIEDTP